MPSSAPAPAWLATWSAFAAGAGYDALPEPVPARAKLALLDTLGAIVAGHQEREVAALVKRLAGRTGAGAPVIGTAAHAAPATAALLNAVAGTALELDEGNRFARGHPAIHVLPAALVAGQRQRSSGRELLAAFTLGYEVAARIGAAATLRPGFHPHGTWGVVGAAVAVARLHGADAARMAETINIASSLSLATSMRTAIEGGTVRNAYAGVANQLGLLAWDLAESGFSGERDGVATVFGLIAGRDFRPEAMTEALGSRWEVARNYFKRHACCRYNHAMLDALEMLIAENGTIAAQEVVGVAIDTYAAAAELDDPAPRNALAAKFSLPFAAAAFLVRGVADVAAFGAEARADAAIRDLAARVHVREEPAFTARLPAQRPARVAVTLRDGRRLVAETTTNRGDADSPYPVAEIEAKFLDLASPGWGEARARKVMAAVLALEEARDSTAFFSLLSS